MNNVEEWRDIEGYEGLYMISNLGRVKSLVGWNGSKYIDRVKILKPSMTTTGYWKIELSKDKKKKSKKIHRLIAKAFIPNTNNKPQINHIDGNPLNNNIDNLEWTTQKENVDHAIKVGLKKVLYIPKEELERLYVEEKKSAQDISEELDIPTWTIYNRLAIYGIKTRSLSQAKIKYNLTEDFILSELQSKSQKQLAKEIGCDQSLISHYLKRIKEKGRLYA